MITEAIGKVLGMAMAYGVSSLGLFLAYVNYRKRIVKADKVMTGKAWTVLAVIVLALAAGILVVADLAQAPPPAAAAPPAPPPPVVALPGAGEAQGGEWPLVGILLPAAIFLFATWITAALYRHYSKDLHAS